MPHVAVPVAHGRQALRPPAAIARTGRLALVVLLAGVGLAGALRPQSSAEVEGGTAAAASRPSAGAAWATVPAAARLALARALGADDARYRVNRAGPGRLVAASPAAGALAFEADGVTVAAAGGSATLRLAGPAVRPIARANRVSYRRGRVTEWYANGPLGLEQGFDVAAGGRRVTLPLALGGSLRARAAGAAAFTFVDAEGAPALRVAGLLARDARGRTLPARFVGVGSGRARIVVEARHARFPVSVDPLVQRATLTASDGVANENLGAVAIDGDTIVVGAPSATVGGNRQGAVYVFTRPASGWADATQVAKLIASDATNLATAGGYYGDSLGTAVAVSGDTVVAGAPIGTNGANPGRLYVWVKPSGGWANAVQNAELNPSDPTQNGQLGVAVAIDGATLVGASEGGYQKPGELYEWTRPAGGWTSVTQTARLTVSGLSGDAALGRSVDVSGATIIAGAPFLDNGSTVAGGAAYVWTRAAAGSWADSSEPAAKLVAAQPITQETLGTGVAVDGTTIVAGASHAESQGGSRPPGSAYVFVRPVAGWSGSQTQTARLTASDPQSDDGFGASVGISGGRIVAGVPIGTGATYVFDEPGGGWVDATEADKLTAAAGGSGQGAAVAVSGATVVASEPHATVSGHSGQGGAAVYEPGVGATSATTTTTAPPPSSPDVTTFAVPPGQITNPTAPAPPPDLTTAADIIAGLFGIKAGSGETVNLGQFTFVAYCSKPAGQCAAGTSFGQQLGHDTAAGNRGLALAARTRRTSAVLARGSFTVPAGQRRKVTVRLTKAGRTLLARRHRIAGYLTLTLKLDGGKTASSVRKLTLKQGHTRR